MKKSLLLTLAMMPTLLIGCKSKKLKEIKFSDGEITFTSVEETKTIELDPRPSGIQINFEEIEWSGSGATEKSIKVEDYVTIALNEKQPEIEGGVVLNFTLKQKLEGKGITVVATYQEFTDDLPLLMDSKLN